ncbi:hypothetical protein AOLI_G00315090 [Acnodon oligacanthus]
MRAAGLEFSPAGGPTARSRSRTSRLDRRSRLCVCPSIGAAAGAFSEWRSESCRLLGISLSCKRFRQDGVYRWAASGVVESCVGILRSEVKEGMKTAS